MFRADLIFLNFLLMQTENTKMITDKELESTFGVLFRTFVNFKNLVESNHTPFEQYMVLSQLQPPFHDLIIGVSLFACLGFSLDGLVHGMREVLYASNNRGRLLRAPFEAINIICLKSEFSSFPE